MYTIRIAYVLGIFFLIVLCVNGNLFAGQRTKSGGYAIGYPSSEKRVEDEEVYEQYDVPVESTPRQKIPSQANEEIRSIDVREKTIAALQRQLSDKDATIMLLEKRVKMLQATVQEKENALYAMQPKPAPLYEVKKGDSLWKIAKRKDTYGNAYMWIKIYNANMNKIKNPAIIYPGQLFEIPT